MGNRAGLSCLIVALLIVAACSDSNGSDAGQDGVSVSGLIVTNADSAGETAADVELTASFRGVTPEIIKVGVMSFDWDRLASLGVRFGRTNSEDLYVGALEEINDRGGIHGRMLEIHPVSILPVGTTEADAKCLELTEDEEVFVVVGVTLGDQIRCIVDDHETAAVVVAGMTEDRKASARAPYATVQNETVERSTAFVDAMEELGLLDGKRIGVTGSLDVSEDAYDFTVEALANAGYDSVGGLTGDNNEDLDASAVDASIVYERFRSEGVELAVSTTGVPLAMANAVNAGYEPDQWALLTSMTGQGLRDAEVDPAYIDGAYSVHLTPIGTSRQPAMADDPVVSACVTDLEERAGRELPYELDVEESDLAGAIAACGFASILEAGLLNAGPDLTNDSFQAGLESIGPIDLPGLTNTVLGPGDLSAGTEFIPTRFNAADEVWEPVE